jgi:hypothetical protein
MWSHSGTRKDSENADNSVGNKSKTLTESMIQCR